MYDLKKRLEEERDRHVAGYPGPRRDVAELLDDALSALTHPVPTHNDGSGEAVRCVSCGEEWPNGQVTFCCSRAKPNRSYTRPDHTSGEVTEADDSKLLDALRSESWDLRCFPVPTGGDDADIGWRVIGHWMAEPHERVIAEVYHDDPRAAIRAALRGDAS